MSLIKSFADIQDNHKAIVFSLKILIENSQFTNKKEISLAEKIIEKGNTLSLSDLELEEYKLLIEPKLAIRCEKCKANIHSSQLEDVYEEFKFSRNLICEDCLHIEKIFKKLPVSKD